MKTFWQYLIIAPLVFVPIYAHAADANPQSGTGGLAVAFTAGALDFALPARQTGVFSSGSGSFNPGNDAGIIGGQFGISANRDLGNIEGRNWALGVNAFLDVGHGSSAVTDTFSGPATVVIPGYTTPANTSISLTTNGASINTPATAAINHTAPGTEVITAAVATNAAGGIDSWAVTTQAPDSFGLAAVTSRHGAVNAAGAYGAVAATDGGIFIGSGDLGGLSITTQITTDVIYSGLDATISASGKPDNGKVLQLYGGPSYRYLNEHTKSDTSVDIPEVAPGDPANYFPLFSMDRDENLTSHYLGGVVGMNAVQPLPNGMLLALNGEAGLYYTLSSLAGSESYSVGGGLNTPVPATTIQNANGINQSATGLAYAARVGSSISMPVGQAMQLTLGGNVEYLSRVASPGRSGASSASSSAAPFGITSDNGTTTYTGQSSDNTLIAFGAMWAFGATASLTGHF